MEPKGLASSGRLCGTERVGFQWKALWNRKGWLPVEGSGSTLQASSHALDEAGNVGVAALKIGVLVILVLLRVRVACRQPRARIGWRRRKQLVKLSGWEIS